MRAHRHHANQLAVHRDVLLLKSEHRTDVLPVELHQHRQRRYQD